MPGGSSANTHDYYSLIDFIYISTAFIMYLFYFIQIVFPFETCNYLLKGLLETVGAIV